MTKEKTSNEERSVTLADLWRVFLTALPLMIIAAILIVGLGFAYRKLTYRQQYASEGSFLVMRDREQIADASDKLTMSQEASFALGMMTTCEQVVTRSTVFDQVAEKLKNDGVNYTAQKVAAAISISTVEKSLIMTIRAVATDPATAKEILVKYMETAKESADTLLGKDNEFVSYCDEPRDAVKTGSFGMARLLLIGILGALLVYAVYLIRDLLDDRIRTGDDIVETAGLTLLGIIPDAYTSERKYAYKYGRKYAKHYGRYGATSTQKKEG